jgi:rubrerythrin
MAMKKNQKLFGGEPVMEIENPIDRRNFFKMAGVIGIGAGLVAVGCGTADDNPGVSPPAAGEALPASDLAILNYALTLEYLEAEFYNRGVEATIVGGRQLEIIEAIAKHESDHVATLTSAIESGKGDPVAKPTFKFPDNTFNDGNAFLKTASTFEELGVNAYHGQVALIKTPALIGAAASIAGIESRHAGVLALLLRTQPFPAPFEASKDMPAVLAAAKPFIAS